MSSSSNNSCISLGQGCTSPTNLPSYIDTASCLCGILKSASSLPDNGEQIELWRCIGNASDNISSGGHGKWYNTSLPSQELSGINKPQNWGENPPDLSQVYVLEDQNGKAVYQKWSSGSSPDLIGADVGCTGKNDTELSTMYYAKGNGSSSSTTSSSASSSATASASGTASSAPATTTSGATTSATGSTTSAGSSPPPTGTSAAAPQFSLSSALLLGMVIAPLVSLLM